MRLAIAGAHRTGKTTLVEELGRALPGYALVDEPYYQLEEEGQVFAEMPSVEDFELQLERSIECIVDSADDQLFDRCPVDIAAYLLTHEDADGFDLEPWVPRIRSAMQRLDLIVYVPVEQPDRIAGAEDDPLRSRVDEQVREILEGDRFGLEVEVIEVTGSVSERARQILRQPGPRR